MKYIRIIRSVRSEEKDDKITDAWDYVYTIPDTLKNWEGKSIESVIKDVEAKFGKLDEKTKYSMFSYLQLILFSSENLVNGKIRAINDAKKYGERIANGIFEDLKKLHKKIYPKDNIAWGSLEGEWWEASPYADGEEGHYIAYPHFSFPIKYRKEVNNILNKWKARYPKVKINPYIYTPSKGGPQELASIKVYNK